MKALYRGGNELKAEKEIAWLLTLLFMVAGFPFLKKAILFILLKLYEFVIAHFGALLP
jgi:Na+/H+ antiporter NhaB